MSMSMEQVMEFARQQWGEGLEPSPSNIHAAAVGLVSNWYRNTNVVETFAHAEGPWSDADMMRKNTWATELARRSIVEVIAVGDDPETVEVILVGLLEEFVAMLPNDSAKRELWSEKQGAPGLATDWISVNGLGNWLAFQRNAFAYPAGWWGTAGYAGIVDQYCSMTPAPPDPENFRQRMIEGPWELSDEQAEFVCRHRYDVG